ncbi:MAG: hypothetical protein M3Y75_12100 [Actinomycetota bacterium]|nr:hypothetical protein [Actinomycetota bacterium]
MARKGDDPGRVEEPDIEIGAGFKAKKLRFHRKPETDVRFHGEAQTPEGRSEIESASGSERRNLPEEVEPGVTYEDVQVRWGAAARIEDPGERDEEDEG